MKYITTELLNELPQAQELKKLKEENLMLRKNSFFPSGHFYSPIVMVDEIREREKEVWKSVEINSIQGIDLKVSEQLKLISKFEHFYNEIPYGSNKYPNVRYKYENDYYSYSDGIILYSMIREYEPKRIVEIGSGYSSAVMLDTNEIFFNNEIELTFIEPYPERLNSLVNDTDRACAKIISNYVQDVPLEIFKQLQSGDVLFIDSSHVVKTGSDVNYILFEILPCLSSGVLIHFHDIFYPFEYLKEWVFNGWNWNEAYFLRAFLMYNTQFDILLFSNYLHKHYSGVFSEMPLCYRNPGANLWLKKI